MSLGILLSSFPPGQDEQQIIENSGITILEIIASASPQIFQSSDEVLIHKFQVKVSGFLKSKSPVSRWFGSYLVKLAVNSSALILKSHGSTWATILIHLLELPEPVVTHYIVIEALGAIFANTYNKQELTRDITTPRLPTFIKLVLNFLKEPSKSDGSSRIILLRGPSIRVLIQILNNQSTTIRPYVIGFRDILLDLLSESIASSSSSISNDLLEDVCKAFVSLHMAATKGSESSEWTNSCWSTINEIHYTIDQIADKLIKEENFNNNAVGRPASVLGLDNIINSQNGNSTNTTNNPLKVLRKIEVLFTLLKAFLTTGTKIPVKLPLGGLEDLSDRLYSLSPSTTIRRPAIDKSQLDTFFSIMENIHIHLTFFNIVVVSVVKNAILEHFDMLFHHITSLMDPSTSKSSSRLQLALLQLATKLLVQISVIPKSKVQSISGLVKPAIKLVQPDSVITGANYQQQLPDFISNPNAFIKPVSHSIHSIVSEFFIAVISTVPDLPLQSRSEIDRYFILSANSHGLNQSALYPGHQARYSVAPMAIRTDSGLGLASSLLHPRLPPLAVSTQNLVRSAILNSENGDENENENENENEPSEIMAVEAPEDIKQPVIPINGSQSSSSSVRKELPTLVFKQPESQSAPRSEPQSNYVPQSQFPSEPQPRADLQPRDLIEETMPQAPPETHSDRIVYDSGSDSDIEIPIIVDSDSDEDM